MTDTGQNYDDMLNRCIRGLKLIKQQSGNLPVVSHSYMIAVPNTELDDYKTNHQQDMKDWGWVFHEDFGWVLAVLA